MATTSAAAASRGVRAMDITEVVTYAGDGKPVLYDQYHEHDHEYMRICVYIYIYNYTCVCMCLCGNIYMESWQCWVHDDRSGILIISICNWIFKMVYDYYRNIIGTSVLISWIKVRIIIQSLGNSGNISIHSMGILLSLHRHLSRAYDSLPNY